MPVAIIVGTGLGELLGGGNLESVATAYGQTLLWRHQEAGHRPLAGRYRMVRTMSAKGMAPPALATGLPEIERGIHT